MEAPALLPAAVGMHRKKNDLDHSSDRPFLKQISPKKQTDLFFSCFLTTIEIYFSLWRGSHIDLFAGRQRFRREVFCASKPLHMLLSSRASFCTRPAFSQTLFFLNTLLSSGTSPCANNLCSQQASLCATCKQETG